MDYSNNDYLNDPISLIIGVILVALAATLAFSNRSKALSSLFLLLGAGLIFEYFRYTDVDIGPNRIKFGANNISELNLKVSNINDFIEKQEKFNETMKGALLKNNNDLEVRDANPLTGGAKAPLKTSTAPRVYVYYKASREEEALNIRNLLLKRGYRSLAKVSDTSDIGTASLPANQQTPGMTAVICETDIFSKRQIILDITKTALKEENKNKAFADNEDWDLEGKDDAEVYLF